MALFTLGRGKSVQIGVTICCLVAFVLFGYDQGVLGGILENEDWQSQFGHPNDTETGVIVSCYNLGCLAGCVINFFLGDKLGRRRNIWLAMGFVLVGATLQASAYTVSHLVIGRVITGFGTGIKTSTVPMYQSELCNPEARGRLVSTEVLFVGVGITIAYWFDFGMSFVGGEIAWRLPIAFQLFFAIGVIILVFALPESPRWLLMKGRDQEAIDVLCQFHDKDPSDPSILAETSSIQRAIELELSSNTDIVFYLPGASSLWNFTVVMITPVIINRLQWKAYLIFMVTNFLFVPIFYFIYPETSNFKLEDIDLVFSQGGNPVSIARQMSKDMKTTIPNDSEISTGTDKEQSVMVEQA
ncbi:hypothetical protein ACHAPJ_006672 [Fusarium lateritium]